MRFINIFLLCVFLMLQYRLWAGSGSVAEIMMLNNKIEAQQTLNEEMHNRNALLIAEVIGLHNGFESIEEYARSQLGLIKPDETFYLLAE